MDNSEEDLEASKQLLDDIKSQLCNSLEQVSSAMSFASSGPCPTTENPGIWIPDVGIIGLPFSERDADLISKVTHPAPYGKGPDTIVDLTFKNTQELNADEFKLRNPNWDKALEAVVRRAATELGVPGESSGVKAMLYKMLLYREGAMFKEHRELVSIPTYNNKYFGSWLISCPVLSSQKHPDMLGTLVICLPSKHKGGEVRVTHGGKEKTGGKSSSSSAPLSTILRRPLAGKKSGCVRTVPGGLSLNSNRCVDAQPKAICNALWGFSKEADVGQDSVRVMEGFLISSR
jgi:hypothetical protein